MSLPYALFLLISYLFLYFHTSLPNSWIYLSMPYLFFSFHVFPKRTFLPLSCSLPNLSFITHFPLQPRLPALSHFLHYLSITVNQRRAVSIP